MTEINDWVPVKGYEGRYEVSGILGKVRSLNYRNTGRVEILDGNHRKDGYVRINLYKNEEMKSFQEHRIVAEHFCSNPLNKPEVNHINEIKDDNRACNLEWVTPNENSNHGTRNERVSIGLTNGITSKQVLQYTKTGEFVREWPSIAECGRNGFDHRNIISCCRGKRKFHKGFIWKYKSAI